jgi:CheY-like chemotaxis protein
MSGNRPRILSIDDEPSFTEMIQQYFEPRGYRIDVATEGRKGLDLLRSRDYDVVLLDLKMVGLNGDEIMREIKEGGSDIKVVFITAYSDSGRTKDRLMKEGAYAFVEKPITSLKFLEGLVNKAFLNDRTGG